MSVATTLDEMIFAAVTQGKVPKGINLSPELLGMLTSERDVASYDPTKFTGPSLSYRDLPITIIHGLQIPALVMADDTFVSFLLGRVIDGRQRVEAVREFPSMEAAKADANERLLMFGNAGWGRKTHDFGPGKEVVVDVMGRA